MQERQCKRLGWGRATGLSLSAVLFNISSGSIYTRSGGTKQPGPGKVAGKELGRRGGRADQRGSVDTLAAARRMRKVLNEFSKRYDINAGGFEWRLAGWYGTMMDAPPVRRAWGVIKTVRNRHLLEMVDGGG